MGKWGIIAKYLANVGLAAGEAAVEKYSGGVIPGKVLDQRAQFSQWPPRPDEIAPGEGGGVSSGITVQLVQQLGALALQLPGSDRTAPLTKAGQMAAEYVARVYGWGTVDVFTLDPDQFYLTRHFVQQWVTTGKEPPHPAPPAVDENALHAQYQKAVAAQNTPWAPPPQPQAPVAQPQTQPGPQPPADDPSGIPKQPAQPGDYQGRPWPGTPPVWETRPTVCDICHQNYTPVAGVPIPAGVNLCGKCYGVLLKMRGEAAAASNPTAPTNPGGQ